MKRCLVSHARMQGHLEVGVAFRTSDLAPRPITCAVLISAPIILVARIISLREIPKTRHPTWNIGRQRSQMPAACFDKFDGMHWTYSPLLNPRDSSQRARQAEVLVSPESWQQPCTCNVHRRQRYLSHSKCPLKMRLFSLEYTSACATCR